MLLCGMVFDRILNIIPKNEQIFRITLLHSIPHVPERFARTVNIFSHYEQHLSTQLGIFDMQDAPAS
jgi:hypothetical protein